MLKRHHPAEGAVALVVEQVPCTAGAYIVADCRSLEPSCRMSASAYRSRVRHLTVLVWKLADCHIIRSRSHMSLFGCLVSSTARYRCQTDRYLSLIEVY
jgi:hypothetical protein